jgi:ABC-2 type transport system permease protein
MSDLKTFWNYIKIELRHSYEYPLNFFVRIFWVCITLIPMYFLWNIIFSQNNATGYNIITILLYLAFSYGLGVWGSIANDIRGEIITGDIVKILVRNISLDKYFFMKIFSKLIEGIIFSLPILIILGFIFVGIQSLQGIILYFLGMILVTIIYSILITTSFWFGNNWGFFYSFGMSMSILSGAIFPLDLYPEYLRFIVDYLPFKLIIFVPAKAYIGEYNITLWLLITYAFWIALFYILLKILIKYGTERYEQLGG